MKIKYVFVRCVFLLFQLHLENIKSQNIELEKNAYKISNGTISNDILEIKWPLGVPESASPETRHDILPWIYLNLTHQFVPDHEHNTKSLSVNDADDLKVSQFYATIF